MKTFKILKGHNLSLEGTPSKSIVNTKEPDVVSFHPSSLKNTKIKLLVKEQEAVKIGTPLYFDKKNEKAVYVSSCSGTVDKILYGTRKSIDSIEIINDRKNLKVSLNSELKVENLLKSGLFTYIRQRPFSRVPEYSSVPKSIFISSMPTEPFAMDYEYLINNSDNYIQKGIDSLKSLYNCDIYFNSASNSIFSNLNNVNHATFNKLHPSGNVGIQIHNLHPIKSKVDTRWYLSLQDLNRIGQFFKTGEYPVYRYVSVGGNAFENPCIFKLLIGTPINQIIDNELDNNTRLISGDLLSGVETSRDNSTGFYDEVLSIIKTDYKRDFLGWLKLGLRKYTLTNTFLSKIISNKHSDLTTKKNGSIRTIIPMGNWDRVMPMNIMTEYLVKNIIAKDIDMMEKLGIYECSPEDFSLCSFVCQSKVEVSYIIEEGLNLIEEEG